jgi:hypothetical protein
MLALHAAQKASTGTVLVLRGGTQLSEPNLAAFVSVSANTLALVLYTVLAQWVRALRKRLAPDTPITNAQELLATVICGMMAYYLTYLLSGFVPMGYVVGARPWIPGAELFAPKR